MKKVLFTIIGVLALVFVFTSSGFAQRYHLTYTGGHFNGDTADNFWKTGDRIGNIGTGSGTSWFYAPVVFPDSANGMQVTRLSCSIVDNSATGNVAVGLYKVDRWSGNVWAVGLLETSDPFAATSVTLVNRPRSLLWYRGIDNNRWAWYLMVAFNEDNTDMWLTHVTIRYE